jgi:hypothetical protein
MEHGVSLVDCDQPVFVLPLHDVIGAEISDGGKPATRCGDGFQFEFQSSIVDIQNRVGSVPNPICGPLKIEQVYDPVLSRVILRRHFAAMVTYAP